MNVKQFGLYVLTFGLATMLLSIFGYEFSVLSWIDVWGEGKGWLIRLGFVAAGAALFYAGRSNEKNSSHPKTKGPASEDQE